jgi:hypothetical protein
LTGAFYFMQASGPAAHSASYFWANPILDVQVAPKLLWETSYFPYLPLNRAAHLQQALERLKLEYAVRGSVKVGAGFGAYQAGDGMWQKKPFITTTVGPVEFWLQEIPAGAEAQVRLKFAYTAKH